MNKALKTSRKETLELLIQDEEDKYKFFECLIEVPYERGYELLKETFNSSRDGLLYLYLERMALALDLVDEALDFSAKVEMVNDKEVLEKEFLHRFLVFSAKKDSLAMEKFFYYASRNKEFIEKNSKNPIIIDFYYQYYLYLLGKEQNDEAKEILFKLHEKQNELNAFVYSPFIDLELSKLEKDKNNFNLATEYLINSLKKARSIKPNDLVKVYYELIKLYDMQNLITLKDEYINKCKSVENTQDSLYKQMCDKM